MKCGDVITHATLAPGISIADIGCLSDKVAFFEVAGTANPSLITQSSQRPSRERANNRGTGLVFEEEIRRRANNFASVEL
jgi:hypothetical protein